MPIPRLRFGSLRIRILAWSFIPTTIILLAVALVILVAYQRVTEDLVTGKNRELARLSAGQVSAHLGTYTDALSGLAQNPDIRLGIDSLQRIALARAGSGLALFDAGIVILDSRGRVNAAEPARPAEMGADWSAQPYFAVARESKRATYSDVLRLGPERVMVLAVPILGDQDTFRGVVLGLFRLSTTGPDPSSGLSADLAELEASIDGRTTIVDSKGQLIYHRDAERVGSPAGIGGAVQQVLGGRVGNTITRNAAGVEVLASYAPIPGTGWGLIIEEDWSGLLASSQGYGQFLFVLLALGVVVPAVVVAVGVGRITQPIHALIQGAQEIAGGQFGREVHVDSGDELEVLVKQFNRMSAQLATTYAELKQREERLALVLQGTNDGIWDWDLKTDDVYFSPRWKSMLGYAEDELSNRFETWSGLLHPDDVENATAHLRDYLERRTPIFRLEIRMRHKDGSYRWISARGGALWDADGRPCRMTGSHTDITERKHSDDALRQSEKRFAQVFRASPIPISITALEDGRYIEVNDAWLSLFGYSRAEVDGTGSLGLDLWVNPEERAHMVGLLQSRGSVRNFEHLARTKSGAIRDVLVSAEVIELNAARYNLSMVFDITERKEAEQALEQRVAERTHELAALNEIAHVVNSSLDLPEIMNAALTRTMSLLQMDVGTAYGLKPVEGEEGDYELVPVARLGMSAEYTVRVGTRRVRGSAIGVAADAHQPVAWRVADFPDPAVKQALAAEGVEQVVLIPLFAKGRFVGSFNIGTRRTRVIKQEELSLLAAIGRQVAIAVENARLYDQAEQSAALAERSRLARELHDSVTQSLYGVTMFAQAAQLSLNAGDTAPAAEYLGELRDTSQEALREMRLLIYELRPPALEHRGLAAALAERLETVEARGGVATNLTVQGVEALPLSLQHELYHIAREGLNNILKHAHARAVCLHLACEDGRIFMEIVDDGVGFDLADQTKGGLGLAGMQERVQKIGGNLEIDTTVGQGTRLVVSVPLSAREEA